jgi:hypothetical protein
MPMNHHTGARPELPKRPAAAERRRNPRHNFSADAEVVEVVSGTRLRMTARVADLSIGGCYLDTINPFAPGTRAHLRIRHLGADFTCVATVKSCQPGMGMGLAFEELDRAHSDLLNSWEARLAAQVPATPVDLDANDLWQTAHPSAPACGNAASAFHTKGAAAEQAAHDDFSHRLATLLHRKGVLTDSEMIHLLAKHAADIL